MPDHEEAVREAARVLSEHMTYQSRQDGTLEDFEDVIRASERAKYAALVEAAVSGIEGEIEMTKNWRASTGMRPATDTSKFAYVPPSGLREIEWHIRELRAALQEQGGTNE